MATPSVVRLFHVVMDGASRQKDASTCIFNFLSCDILILVLFSLSTETKILSNIHIL